MYLLLHERASSLLLDYPKNSLKDLWQIQNAAAMGLLKELDFSNSCLISLTTWTIPDRIQNSIPHVKKFLITKLHHISKRLWCHNFPTEPFLLRLLVYLFLEVLKFIWEAEPSVISLLSCEISSQFGYRRQTHSIPLRLGFKFFFLIKLVVCLVSSDPEPLL